MNRRAPTYVAPPVKRLVPAALGLLAALAAAVPAAASEHLMKVNELLLSADGSDTSRFAELVDPLDEPFPGPLYRLRSYDAAGNVSGSQTLNNPFTVRDNTSPYLVSTAAADAKYGATGDQVWSLALPAGNAGQVCFENQSSGSAIHCLSYGSITTPVVAQGGNDHAARPADGRSLQRCSSGLVAGAPTPRAGNACGSGGGGGGGGGGTTDKRKPKTTLGGKKTQDVDKLTVTVKLDENGSATASGTVRVPNSSKVYRFTKVKKAAKAGKRVKLRLRLKRKPKRAVKAALGAGRKLKAKITAVATDKAGNKTTKRRTVKLRR